MVIQRFLRIPFLLVFIFHFLSLPVGEGLSSQIHSITSCLAYQKGPIFVKVPNALVVDSKEGMRIHCPEVKIVSPFSFSFPNVTVWRIKNGVYFLSDTPTYKIHGRIFLKNERLAGSVKVVIFPIHGRKGIDFGINFSMGEEDPLSGEIFLGMERVPFYWLDKIHSLYVDLDGVDLANLTYFFLHKVEGQGILKGGVLISCEKGEVVGGAMLSGRGWLGQGLLSFLKVRAVSIGEGILPVDWVGWEIKGRPFRLSFTTMICSVLGRFSSQYFFSSPNAVILIGSKGVER